ncbi:hypothetical protein JCM9743_06110 [Natrinema sp. JCM 9743]
MEATAEPIISETLFLSVYTPRIIDRDRTANPPTVVNPLVVPLTPVETATPHGSKVPMATTNILALNNF